MLLDGLSVDTQKSLALYTLQMRKSQRTNCATVWENFKQNKAGVVLFETKVMQDASKVGYLLQRMDCRFGLIVGQRFDCVSGNIDLFYEITNCALDHLWRGGRENLTRITDAE